MPEAAAHLWESLESLESGKRSQLVGDRNMVCDANKAPITPGLSGSAVITQGMGVMQGLFAFWMASFGFPLSLEGLLMLDAEGEETLLRLCTSYPLPFSSAATPSHAHTLLPGLPLALAGARVD